jgi:hypothetical protein
VVAAQMPLRRITGPVVGGPGGGGHAPRGRPAAFAGPSRDPAYNALAVTPPLPDLVLYARPGCGLCDETRTTLHALLAERSARGLPVADLVERDIDTDEDWHRRYAFTIPVVVLGERELELATSPAKLRRLLEDGLGGERAAAR